MAADIKIGCTAFLDQMGVGSELETKTQCLKDNRIMFHAHMGMGSWESTAAALEYARRLKEEMARRGADIPVVLGGILNQKVASQSLPVDVTGDLKKLGFNPCPKLGGNFRRLLENNI